MDAIARARGSLTSDTSGVRDSVFAPHPLLATTTDDGGGYASRLRPPLLTRHAIARSSTHSTTDDGGGDASSRV